MVSSRYLAISATSTLIATKKQEQHRAMPSTCGSVIVRATSALVTARRKRDLGNVCVTFDTIVTFEIFDYLPWNQVYQ